MLGGAPTLSMWSSSFGPQNKMASARTMRRVAGLFFTYWQQCLALLVCILATVAVGLAPPLLAKMIIDKGIPEGNATLIIIYSLEMIASAVLYGVAGVFQGYLSTYIGENIVHDVRTQLLTHLLGMPVDFFTSTKTGTITNRISSDIESVKGALTGTFVAMVVNLLLIVSTGVAIVAMNWRLGLVALAILPLMTLPLRPVGKRMYEVRRGTREKRDVAESLIQESVSVSGAILIKSLVSADFEKERFEVASAALRAAEIRLALVGRWFVAAMNMMTIIGPAIVWMVGGILVVSHAVTIGTVVAFVAYLGRLYLPASALATAQVQVISAFAVFERIFEYLDMPPESNCSETSRPLARVVGSVTFQNVSFEYSPGRPALADIDFHIHAGQTAAFVGPSGAGKTTIAHLLPRFYKPQTGRILIDGVDAATVTLDSLRSQMAIVTQDTYLFHDTIASNLRYARRDATDSELESALVAANLDRLVAGLPDGIHTVVGERGYKLSGGERQRLAIARVILRNPRILVLDEATSALDSLTESAIARELERLMESRTSLVIAHRLATVVNADVIFVLENGLIVERGTHPELLQRNAAYARLYMEQFKECGSPTGRANQVPLSAPT